MSETPDSVNSDTYTCPFTPWVVAVTVGMSFPPLGKVTGFKKLDNASGAVSHLLYCANIHGDPVVV